MAESRRPKKPASQQARSGKKKAALKTSVRKTEGKRAATVPARDELYQAIVENQLEFVDRYLPGGILTFVNRSLAEHVGMRPEDLIGKSFYAFLDNEDLAVLLQKLEQLTPKQPAVTVQNRVVMPGGGERWHQWTHQAFFDKNGKACEYQSVGRDITEQRLMEERIHEQSRLASTILDNVGAAIFIKDNSYRYTYVNRRTCEIFGKPAEEILGKTDEAFFSRESLEEIMRSDRPVIERGETISREEVSLTSADGKPHTYWTAKLPLRNAAGAVTALCGISTDITERKLAEQSLAHMHELMQYVISHAQGAIAVHDKDMKYIYVSDNYLKQYGVKEKDVIGKHHYAVFPDLPQKWRDVHQRVLKGAVEGKEEDPYVRADGSVDWTRWSCRPWYLHDGSIGGLIVYTEVITERKRREEALKHREQQLSESQRIAHIGSWEHNLKTGSVFWSDELFRLLGLDPARDPADFKQFFARVHPDDQRMLKESIGRTKDEGLPFSIEYRFVLPDGSVRIIHAQAELKSDVAGELVVLSGTAQDITDRKQQERALAESEANYRNLFESSTDGIFILDLDGNFIDANRTACERLGYAREEFLGLNIRALDHPSFASQVPDRLRQIREKGFALFESGHLRKDGSLMPVEVNSRLLEYKGKQVYFSVIRDITERKRAEEQVRQSEQFVRNILDTVDEGFIVVDRDYRIVTANRAYCEQAGMPCDSVIGKHCFEISHKVVRPCYEEGEECAVRDVFASGEPCTVSHQHRDADGHVIYVETKAFPVKDHAGRVISAIETINNITERHLLEEERLKSQKLESIGTLAGGIAHDFNNLLQGIFGYISMAKMTYDQRERSLEMLEQAEKALHQSVNLTSQLLTFSKGGKPVRKVIDLRPVIENAARFALSGSRSSLIIQVSPDLRQVEADAGQIGQVVQNIVLNADQAMPTGGTVTITARAVAGNAPDLPQGLAKKDHVAVSIRDAGIGIAEQYLSKIFDPYFTTKEKGSGLGLATSYSIIKNHDGVIRVESSHATGTAFTLYLPAAEAGVKQQAAPQVSAGGRKGRILVMDDEAVVRAITGELISAIGHETSFAEDGASAIAQYQEARSAGRPFDAVILDLTVRGGMGGLETLQRLKGVDPAVKAVVSSGYSDEAAVADFQERGFLAFLQKPYEINELQRTLSKLIG